MERRARRGMTYSFNVVGLALLVVALAIAPAATAGGLRTATALPSVVASIPVGTTPGYDHYDTGTGETYVSNTVTNNVSVISDARLAVVASVAVGATPKGLDYDPSHGNIWVANSGATSLSIINDTSHSVVGTSSGATTAPTRPEYDPLAGTMWVTSNITAGVVHVYNLTSPYALNTTIHMRAGTNTVGIDKDVPARAMLVSNYGSANVTVFSLTNYTKLATIAVGTHPEAMSCLAALDACYVANQGSNSLSVIDTLTWAVTQTIVVGTAPIGVTTDNATNDVYVTNSLAGTVSVVSGVTNAVIATLTVGASPHGITSYDPVRGLVFCVNQGSNNVSVINDGTGGTGGGGGIGGGSSAASAIGNLLIVIVAVGLVMVVLMALSRYSGRGQR